MLPFALLSVSSVLYVSFLSGKFGLLSMTGFVARPAKQGDKMTVFLTPADLQWVLQ